MVVCQTANQVDSCYDCVHGPFLDSEVDKIFEILIKTSNVTKYIESDIQNIETPRTDDSIF